MDALTGEQIGLDPADVSSASGDRVRASRPLTGETNSLDDQFPTFEDLFSAYKRQVEFSVEALADRHHIEYQVEDESAAFLFVSMLYDDCIARGKSLVGGGVRYQGGLIETYGMVNAADSLTAIKSLVYDQKITLLQQMVTVLDADFAGYEQ